REPLDVPGRQCQTPRRHQDVRGLPRRSRGERKLRAACRTEPPDGDVDGRLFARAQCEEGRSAWIVSIPCRLPLQISRPAQRRKPPAFPASSMSSPLPREKAASASPPPPAISRSALPRLD